MFLFFFLAWGLALALLLGWVFVSESKGHYIVKWPLKITAFLLRLSSTVFAIPLMTALLTVLNCGTNGVSTPYNLPPPVLGALTLGLAFMQDNRWRVTGAACWSGEHIAMATVCCLLASIVAAAALLTRLYKVDR